ncbi:MAG: hypothetical protein HN842_10120 [Gammaproteobacteria bacterium]|nr:hypothetical protein [Gammaproteobacteria bacterium]MBT7308562.1 hypothetical protein [Gammaproteobacteria bacterium]
MEYTIMEQNRQPSELTNRPQLPPFLSAPLQLVPDLIHTQLLVRVLNHLFKQPLQEGELDFLESRTAVIRLLDGGVEFRFTKGRKKLVAHSGSSSVDLAISGNLYDFIQLSLGKEDPDTLFFQRRIRLEGDVELGLEIKNLLYGLELDSLTMPTPLRKLVRGAVDHYQNRITTP